MLTVERPSVLTFCRLWPYNMNVPLPFQKNYMSGWSLEKSHLESHPGSRFDIKLKKRRPTMSLGNYDINTQCAVVEAVLYSRNLFSTFEVQDFLFNIWNNFNQKKWQILLTYACRFWKVKRIHTNWNTKVGQHYFDLKKIILDNTLWWPINFFDGYTNNF